MLLSEIKSIQSSKSDLRKFGYIIFAACGLVTGYIFWKTAEVNLYFSVIGALFLLIGLVVPIALKPIHKVWMTAAVVMGFFISRIILGLLFFIVFTPIGIIMRIAGKDLLDRKLDKNSGSYWIKRNPADWKPEYTEKQF